MKIAGLPLFILGPDFFPSFTGTLRVFEPRYKQMMDDCIMSSKPFGYISADSAKEKLNGWSQPSDYGVLCYVREYEESGSNLIIEIEGTAGFRVDNFIQPVLPKSVDIEKFPSVEELMQEAGDPVDGKLYFRADVELTNTPAVDFDAEEFKSFLSRVAPARQILQMSSMYKGQIIEFKEHENYIDDYDRSNFLWKVCSALCYDSDLQRLMLKQLSFSSLMDICTNSVDRILARLGEEE